MVQITESSKQKGAHFAFSATTFATTKVQSSIFPPRYTKSRFRVATLDQGVSACSSTATFCAISQ